MLAGRDSHPVTVPSFIVTLNFQCVQDSCDRQCQSLWLVNAFITRSSALRGNAGRAVSSGQAPALRSCQICSETACDHADLSLSASLLFPMVPTSIFEWIAMHAATLKSLKSWLCGSINIAPPQDLVPKGHCTARILSRKAPTVHDDDVSHLKQMNVQHHEHRLTLSHTD